MPDTFGMAVLFGKNRVKLEGDLCEYDIVVTSFATLVRDYQKDRRIYEYNWFRVVLDEGQTLRLTSAIPTC